MKIEKMKVRLTFTEDVLGTANNNKDLHAEYIASKAETQAQTEEELAAIDVPAEIAKAKTVFPRKDGKPGLWDYQVRGFFKEAIGNLVKLGEVDAGQCSFNGVAEAVDHRLFVAPRFVAFTTTEVRELTRPLRAMTAQGPRVALATSELLPAGTALEFTVQLLCGLPTQGKKKVNTLTADDLRAALNYGSLVGLGQWRTGGFGRFTWQELAN